MVANLLVASLPGGEMTSYRHGYCIICSSMASQAPITKIHCTLSADQKRDSDFKA